MKKYYLFIIVALITVVIAYFFIPKHTPTVTINKQIFKVELAETNAARSAGLSNRDQLDKDTGMLFVFPEPGIYPFWMKNTKIPLDIIYINEGLIVEMITLPAETSDNTPEYTPEQKANYVLELGAGSIQKYNLKVGDAVTIHR